MKIAATYENGKIFQHFGHTEAFKFYETNDQNQIISEEVCGTEGQGHGALAGFLKERGIRILLCGGIGPGAQMALAEAGIELYAGISGDADEAVSALLAGNLPQNAAANCNHHHGHEEGHSCAEHGCGSHDCHHHE